MRLGRNLVDGCLYVLDADGVAPALAVAQAHQPVAKGLDGKGTAAGLSPDALNSGLVKGQLSGQRRADERRRGREVERPSS